MNHRIGFLVFILLAILACQIVPTPPALRATSPAPVAKQSQTPMVITTASILPEKQITSQPTYMLPVPGELHSIPYPSQLSFAEVNLQEWKPNARSTLWQIDLPVSLAKVENIAVADGLTLRQRDMLSNNGFVIVHSQEPQFFDLHQRVSLFYGQPYFQSADAAFYALKITSDELITALEREELHRRLTEVIRATFEKVQTYFPHVVGTDLETDTRQAAAYLGVGLRLLDPSAVIPSELEEPVETQVKQILTGRGVEQSVLLPGFQDDFRLYRPTGHYAGDSQLEDYYRGLTWLERVEFTVSGGLDSSDQISKIPMIVTLAMRQSVASSGPAVDDWVRISETLDFINGAPQSGGPGEFARVMDLVYGRMMTILSLQEPSGLDEFRSRLSDLPFPDTLSHFSNGAQEGSRLSRWSFLGVRSQIDELILRRLTAETLSVQDTPRLLPGGQELMAVLGAPVAMDVIKTSGGEYRADQEMIAVLKSSLASRSDAAGIVSAHEHWLRAYQQLLAFSNADPDDDHAPLWAPFMIKPAWGYKELNSALGSWAELRFDTREISSDSGKTASQPDQSPQPVQAYVEPNPLVFYQLARLAFITAEGLKQRGLTGVFAANPKPHSLSQLLNDMIDLADRLQRLGDIAARELAGEPLGAADYALIQAPLGPAESHTIAALWENPQLRPDPAYRWNSLLGPVPGISAIDFGGERLLQVGTGGVDRIFVLVPLEGKIFVAQGGVFSYFEFSQLRDGQMSVESWRKLLIDAPPEPPVFSSILYLSEGVPINVLAFRIGDRYRVLPSAGTLSLRLSPSVDGRIAQTAYPGDVISLLDGPVRANGFNWWRIQIEGSSTDVITGWIAENKDLFERLWN